MDEMFKSMFNNYKKGEISNLELIVDYSLPILEEELPNEEYSEKGILILIKAIEDYNFEKFSSFDNYVRLYIKKFLLNDEITFESSNPIIQSYSLKLKEKMKNNLIIVKKR